jgi:hypothetical protein
LDTGQQVQGHEGLEGALPDRGSGNINTRYELGIPARGMSNTRYELEKPARGMMSFTTCDLLFVLEQGF